MITGLTGGVYYDIRVVAHNIVGRSDPSGAVRVVAATLPEAPDQPIIVMHSSQIIPIQWTAPDSGGAAITSYAVYCKSSTDATYSLVGETTPNTVFFTERYRGKSVRDIV